MKTGQIKARHLRQNERLPALSAVHGFFLLAVCSEDGPHRGPPAVPKRVTPRSVCGQQAVCPRHFCRAADMREQEGRPIQYLSPARVGAVFFPTPRHGNLLQATLSGVRLCTPTSLLKIWILTAMALRKRVSGYRAKGNFASTAPFPCHEILKIGRAHV